MIEFLILAMAGLFTFYIACIGLAVIYLTFFALKNLAESFAEALNKFYIDIRKKL